MNDVDISVRRRRHMAREDVIQTVREGGDLSWVEAADTEFRKCHFANARLANADLSRCNFSEAFFTRADLRGALLDGANLEHVEFHGCNLTNACLRNALIDRCDFSFAIGIVDAGIDWRGYRFIGVRHSDGWRIKAGCRWFTVQQAREHWASTNNDDALARVSLIVDGSLRETKEDDV